MVSALVRRVAGRSRRFSRPLASSAVLLAVVGGILLLVYGPACRKTSLRLLKRCSSAHALCYLRRAPAPEFAIVLRALGMTQARQYFGLPSAPPAPSVGSPPESYVGIGFARQGATASPRWPRTPVIFYLDGAAIVLRRGLPFASSPCPWARTRPRQADAPAAGSGPSVFALLADGKFMLFLVFSVPVLHSAGALLFLRQHVPEELGASVRPRLS